MRKEKRTALLAAVLAGSLCLAACGTTSVSDGSKTSSDDTETSQERLGRSDSEDADPVVVDAKAYVEGQLQSSEGFDGPTAGPEGQEGKTVIYVASDLNNGSISSVSSGAKEASLLLGWKYEVLDGQGSDEETAAMLQQAIEAKPDGIILGGFNASEYQENLDEATAQGISVVGWHAAADVGANEELGLFNNITTDPIEVSKSASLLAIAQSEGTANVVIFTDSQFEIAVAKAEAIKAEIETCSGCKVLEIKDTPIADAEAEMPKVIKELEDKYGDELTHLLAINDSYFTGALPALESAGKEGGGPPFNISAGDGDADAFDRIRFEDYQYGTVAEPVFLQGWQIADELNRSFAGEAPSDYVAPPAMVTAENIPEGNVFDPVSDYRKNFKEIWKVG